MPLDRYTVSAAWLRDHLKLDCVVMVKKPRQAVRTWRIVAIGHFKVNGRVDFVGRSLDDYNKTTKFTIGHILRVLPCWTKEEKTHWVRTGKQLERNSKRSMRND